MLNTIDESEIRDLLTQVSSRLTSHREYLELYSSEFAPNFNIFDIVTPNENKISDVIAFFLDPQKGHGQGDIFLRCFLQIMQIKDTITDLDQLAIRREKLTKENRRIDIVIEKKHGLRIGIENKPWAGDQPKQVLDYIEYLRKPDENFHFLYLHPQGSPPTDESIPEKIRIDYENKGKFKIVSYSLIRDWIKKCRDICQADRVRIFLKDFETYLQHTFEGGATVAERNIIVNQALGSQEALEAALYISYSVNEIKNSLLGRLEKNIRDRLKNDENNLELIWELKDWEKKSYVSFYFVEKEWRNYRISFEAQSTGLNNMIYGIKNDKDDKAYKDNEDNKTIYNFFDGDGAQSAWWTWYCDFEEPNWGINVEPWLYILEENCKMAEIIIEKVKYLYEGLKKCTSEKGIAL